MYEIKIICWPQLHPSLQILHGFILFPTRIYGLPAEHAFPDASPEPISDPALTCERETGVGAEETA